MKKANWTKREIKPKPKTRKKYITKRIKKERAKWFTLLAISGIAMCIVLGFIEDYKKEVIIIINSENGIIEQVEHKNPTNSEILPKTSTPEITAKQQIEKIAKLECDKRSLGDYCVKDMTAITYVESRFNPKVKGDSGLARGVYQIHLGYHPDISIEQAEDINFATAWTLNRLVKNGYPVYRSNSIRLHNGGLNNPKTLTYLQSVNNYIKTIN